MELKDRMAISWYNLLASSEMTGFSVKKAEETSAEQSGFYPIQSPVVRQNE